MKRRFALSIRARLVVLVAVSLLAAVAVIVASTAWSEARRYAAAKRDGLFSTAETIAAAAGRAVAERDVGAAYQTIRAMGRIDGLTWAGIELTDGTPLADVGATEQLASDIVLTRRDQPTAIGALIASRSLEVRVPVIYAGETVGTLRLMSDTRDLPKTIASAVSAVVLGGAVALALALALALRLQTAITRPLSALTAAMSRVRTDHDYSVTLTPERRDEIGLLVEGFNGMIADIRERDDRLARHRERLEQDVADRTADHRRAAAEAEAANRAKSDFLATMSHEIRTPMNGILVMAELLAAAELPERARRQAAVIARSGGSLLAIIDDILDLSKIEAGKLTVETMAVDPVVAVDTVAELFADRARAKGLDLALRVEAPRGSRIVADPTRLGQVLSNLVNNALKFTETGGVVVSVACHGADRLRFAVADSGIGIAEDKLPTIFEAFSQADQTTTRRFGGTGLGLTIARRLVAAMGGEIEVTSRPGVGTTFFFDLALAPAEYAPVEAVAAPAGEAPTALLRLALPRTGDAVAARLAAAGFRVERIGDDTSADAIAAATMVVADAEALIAEALPRPANAVVALGREDAAIDAAIAAGRAEAGLSWPVSPDDLDRLIARRRAGRPLRDDLGEAHPGAIAGDLAGLRVLVADDAEVNREVADAALQRLGIRADFVEDGRKAVDAVLAKGYDLVLMDGSMPNLDGYAATRMIRAAEAADGRRRTPVVALTAHVVGTAADAWRDAGMDGVLHKPFTLRRLEETLRAHADHTTREPEVATDVAPAPAADETSLLDTAVLADLLAMTGGDTTVVDRIARLYRVQSAERLAELAAAAEAQDLDRIGRAGHALKSMSFNVGARGVAEAAAEIERGARLDGRIVAPDDLRRLDRALDDSLAALDGWRSSIG